MSGAVRFVIASEAADEDELDVDDDVDVVSTRSACSQWIICAEVGFCGVGASGSIMKTM